MADCPKCGKHLRLIDWKQKCPHCGANVFLYNLQERLMQDADKAEVQHFYYQKKLDRAKASYLGSRLAVVRIFTSLLPVCAVFLPLCSAVFTGDYADLPQKLDAIKIYNMTDAVDLGAFAAALWQTDMNGRLFLAAFGCLTFSLLVCLAHFLLLFLACSPHGRLRNYLLQAPTLLSAAAFIVLLFQTTKGPGMVTAPPAVGAYVYFAMCVVNLAFDIAVFRQGIDIQHKPCYVGGIPIEEYFEMQKNGMPQEEIRQEQYRRLTLLQQEKEKELEELTARKEKEAAKHG